MTVGLAPNSSVDPGGFDKIRLSEYSDRTFFIALLYIRIAMTKMSVILSVHQSFNGNTGMHVERLVLSR
jgi:hypothetical protein